MADFKPWEYASPDTISVVGGPIGNPKKLTGTRLGEVLDLDSWGSPFQAWCEMCRVAESPFTGNKYTEAGNALEPKLVEWCKENVSPYVYTPEEFYGVPDAKQAKRYDFFPSDKVKGGMWDAVVLDGPLGKGKPLGYVEAKTSSRPQDWESGPPAKYMTQGLLYGHLDSLPRVFIVVRFMEQHEYDCSTDCVCSDENTFLYDLPVDSTEIIDGMTIADCVAVADSWYTTHVEGNVSPPFDEKRDKEYLKILRKSEIKDNSVEGLAKKAALLEAKIESVRAESGLDEMEKQLKDIKDKHLKPKLVEMFGPTDEAVTAYGWQVKKSQRTGYDEEAMTADNVLDKYQTTTVSYTMTKTKGN